MSCFTGLIGSRSDLRARPVPRSLTGPRIMRVPHRNTIEVLAATSANAGKITKEAILTETDPYVVEAQLVDEDKSM